MKLRWRYRPKDYKLNKYGKIIRMKNAEIARLTEELDKIKSVNWKLGLGLYRETKEAPGE